MTSRVRRIVLVFLVAGLGAANLALVLDSPDAHRMTWWSNYHWTKSRIATLTYASKETLIDGNNALASWRPSDLDLPMTTSHTDISLYDGDWGDNGWWGLATVTPTSNGEITHCHARLNRFYKYVAPGKTLSWMQRGVYCQELGHCFGLGHDYTAGCMNASAIFGGQTNLPSSENINALNSRY